VPVLSCGNRKMTANRECAAVANRSAILRHRDKLVTIKVVRMKKKALAIVVLAFANIPSAAMAIPNPASVFCGKMGGKTVIAKVPEGEIGLCYLSKDKIVDEWTLYRMFKGKKPPDYANPFLSR
jgi:uncharacterized protein